MFRSSTTSLLSGRPVTAGDDKRAKLCISDYGKNYLVFPDLKHFMDCFNQIHFLFFKTQQSPFFYQIWDLISKQNFMLLISFAHKKLSHKYQVTDLEIVLYIRPQIKSRQDRAAEKKQTNIANYIFLLVVWFVAK